MRLDDDQFHDLQVNLVGAIREGFRLIADEVEAGFEDIATRMPYLDESVPNAIDRGLRNIDRSIETTLGSIWSTIDSAAQEVKRRR